ncbi:MAG: response regulator [Ruminococcaceae bacterium]|nr:response regulator [Oscillospiraceae bacterium]
MKIILIQVMIYLGIALMALNIYKYVRFSREIRARGDWKSEANILRLPVILLFLFLVGYIAVALFGHPDLVVAGILFGGSIFVFIMVLLMRRIERRIQINGQMQAEIEAAKLESEAKTRFLSNMSHEIRTPMNAIIGLDNLALRDDDLKPKTREQLEKIGASANHLLALINDILDMSRIESGRMVLKNEEFSFREFIDQVSIIIHGQCMDKGLNYECHIEGHPNDYYFGDEMKLKQVLINILGNSVKFTDSPGTVSLTVKQLEQNDEKCILQFIMKDTGIGMDDDFIPKLFDAFSQEDTTTTNKYGGSGLGMAISKNFIEMLNGTVEVESKKGVGSVFTVTVELGKSEQSYFSKHGFVLPKDLRALIVDDDEIACEHAMLVLSSMDIQTDWVMSASAAVDMFNSAISNGVPYDIVITDYKMPKIDGLELTKQLRKISGDKTIIILLTGYNWDSIEDEAKNDGIDIILTRPLFSEVLLHHISSLLEKKKDVIVSHEQEEKEALEQSILSGKRVLIVEDVEANAEILADILELEEMESERAENGQIAVDMFSEHEKGYYDAILMDVRMPVMDGLTATETIRALEREDAREIPIIAMTANVFDEDVERSFKAGMNAHLSKPIEPDRIFETLAELIKK